MKKEYLTIPKPCHENWDKMTIEEKGRHCAVCDKVVKDFTNSSKEAILSEVKSSSEEVCGRISITDLTPINRRQGVYFWMRRTIPRISYAALAFLGFASVFKKNAYSQSVPGGIAVRGNVSSVPDEQNIKQKLFIVVENEQGEKVRGATIRYTINNQEEQVIKANNKGHGTVTYEVPSIGHSFITINISAPGYEPKSMNEIRLNGKEQTIKITLGQQNNIMLLGAIGIHDPEDDKSDCSSDSNTTKKNNRNVDIALIDQPTLIPLKTKFKPIAIRKIKTAKKTKDLKIVDQPIVSKFKSFPNPTYGTVNITAPDNQPYIVKVYNANGVLVLEEAHRQERSVVSLQGLPAGTYLLQFIISSKAIETHKIILTK